MSCLDVGGQSYYRAGFRSGGSFRSLQGEIEVNVLKHKISSAFMLESPIDWRATKQETGAQAMHLFLLYNSPCSMKVCRALCSSTGREKGMSSWANYIKGPSKNGAELKRNRANSRGRKESLPQHNVDTIDNMLTTQATAPLWYDNAVVPSENNGAYKRFTCQRLWHLHFFKDYPNPNPYRFCKPKAIQLLQFN